VKASSVLEPQQFGSSLHEPFLARASEPGAEHGRHALGAFLTLRLADRFRPDEEPSHPLALAYQIRATRDYLLDLHPQNAEVKHLLEVVRLADAVQKGAVRSTLWPPLLAYAFWLEENLQLEQALDTVETALGLNDESEPTEEIAALLQRARVLRLLGRLEEARISYEAARKQAVAAGDVHSTLLARIGDAIVTQQLGNLRGSEQALRAILADATAAGDRDAQARAHHDLGAVLVHRALSHEAVPHLYQAFELYERPAHKLRALSDVGEALKREGKLSAARDAFMVVLRSGPSEEMRACTMIALLELSGLMGDRVGFSRWRRELATMADALPAERLADFHLQLGLASAAFGRLRAAEHSLRQAIDVSEQHRLNEYAFRAEAALKGIKTGSAPNRPGVPAWSEAEDSGEFAEIAEKLEALRAG
jgi:tetratricopeptide (TPR) repeat protein